MQPRDLLGVERKAHRVGFGDDEAFQLVRVRQGQDLRHDLVIANTHVDRHAGIPTLCSQHRADRVECFGDVLLADGVLGAQHDTPDAVAAVVVVDELDQLVGLHDSGRVQGRVKRRC